MLVKVLQEFIVWNAIFPRRRVVILQRSDGYFSYGEEYYYVSEYEGEIIAEGWAESRECGIYADVESAERDAKAQYGYNFPDRT